MLVADIAFIIEDSTWEEERTKYYNSGIRKSPLFLRKQTKNPGPQATCEDDSSSDDRSSDCSCECCAETESSTSSASSSTTSRSGSSESSSSGSSSRAKRRGIWVQCPCCGCFSYGMPMKPTAGKRPAQHRSSRGRTPNNDPPAGKRISTDSPPENPTSNDSTRAKRRSSDSSSTLNAEVTSHFESLRASSEGSKLPDPSNQPSCRTAATRKRTGTSQIGQGRTIGGAENLTSSDDEAIQCRYDRAESQKVVKPSKSLPTSNSRISRDLQEIHALAAKRLSSVMPHKSTFHAK